MKVRTRTAPSPTGYLHVGNAWSAFFNWLLTRNQRGVFVLRVEDTDRSRSTEEFETSVLEDFKWLGIDWDEGPDVGGGYGPYRQTERMHLYRQYADELRTRRAAYHCYCTPEELDAERKQAEAAGGAYRYSGRCRDLSESQRAAFLAEGRVPTVRMRIDPGPPIVVDDLVQGRVEFGPEHLDDFIIVRSNGTPLYNFANVVDDHLMAITHIVRGSEHLNNTPRQLLIYQALGWTPPQVAHLPVILGTDRKKLSKRHGDTAVRDYRRAGYLPEALRNFFALMAWYPEEDREIYSMQELIQKFRIQDVNNVSPTFDVAKLTWMNGVYMRDLIARDPDRVVTLCQDVLKDAGLLDGRVTPETRTYIARVIDVLGDRIKIGRDILAYGDFFFTDGVTYEPDAVKKYFSRKDVAATLGQLRDRIARAGPFEAGAVETIVREMATDLGLQTGEIIHPVRVALTGKTAGPGLFELMALLGRDRVVQRLDSAIDWIRSATS
ncbi:MAG: glutamate--tRNA ligase [Armatimonadetes bacterium]|nr:glutamate--tRNA ligase [Armatimonadota bacterium]